MRPFSRPAIVLLSSVSIASALEKSRFDSLRSRTTMQLKAIIALSVVFAAPILAATELEVVSYVPFVKEGGRTTVPGAANGAYSSHNSTHLAYYGMLDTEAPVKAYVPTEPD